MFKYIILLLSCNYVFASESAKSVGMGYFLKELDTVNEIIEIDAKSLCNKYRDSNGQTVLSPELRSCIKKYEDLYSKDKVNISINLGYIEHSKKPDVMMDQTFKLLFMFELTRSCEEDFQCLTKDCGVEYRNDTCGFQRDPDDEDKLFKDIIGLDGKSKRIEIKLSHSSYSKSKSKNEKDPAGKVEQMFQTFNAQNQFEDSLRHDDIILYIGHARYGTGPGFGPRPLNFMEKIFENFKRPGLKRMTEVISQRKKPAHLIGMITCHGQEYYGNAIRGVAPNTPLLLTNQASFYNDSMYLALNTIDSILAMKCKMAFDQSLNRAINSFSTHKFDTKTKAEKLPILDGFFDTPSEFDPSPWVPKYIFLEDRELE